MRKKRRFLLILGALLLAGLGAAIGSWYVRGTDGGPTAPAGLGEAREGDQGQTGSTPPGDRTPVSSEPLRFEVDRNLRPAVPAVGPGDFGTTPRPTGRIVDGEGETYDLVLEEAIVLADTEATLQAFLTNWGGTILEREVQGEPLLALVRIPPQTVDLAAVAAGLRNGEPDHAGTYRVSDEGILALLAVLADSFETEGIDVSLNWVAEGDGIREGVVQESPGLPNPFDWWYYRVGGSLDIGVGAAWQLLLHHGRLLPSQVSILVVDGGFEPNPDFPLVRRIHYGDWGEENSRGCSGGSECPYHGTHVAVTAVGQVDNAFGVAGVAGPVAELEALQNDLDFWTGVRRTRNVVRDVHPAVVNMSFSWDVRFGRAASQALMDMYAKQMVDAGSIPFASAGNDGQNVDAETCIGNKCWERRLTIPCESIWVVCVGGLADNYPAVHAGSNYGTKNGPGSVQIYAPFCVQSLANAAGPGTETRCGTSFSSPFAAGVAALIKAANPDLTPVEIWSLLDATAHRPVFVVPEWDPDFEPPWVNALGAVAAALGAELGPPTVTIVSPGDGSDVTVADWVELRAEAIDFKGQPLKVAWSSSIDGDLGSDLEVVVLPEGRLSAGVHVLTATATDYRGTKTSRTITLTVIDRDPELTIHAPPPGTAVYEGTSIKLSGSAYDPDTQQFLPEDALIWRVFGSGVEFTVPNASAYTTTIPKDRLGPGTYTAVFSARVVQGGTTKEFTVSRKFTVMPVPAGESPPTAQILTDLGSGEFGTTGDPLTFEFAGEGTDTQDGLISGTRYRWIARSDAGEERVLCTGSSFGAVNPPTPTPTAKPSPFPIAGNQPTPTPTLPSIGILKNCATVTATLGLSPGRSWTVWTVQLEVKDSAGLTATDTAVARITFVVP